jgi:uncharacterized membrane protein required for colicin V production
MSSLDVIIILMAVGIVGFLTYQRMARGLFTLAVLWAATLLAALLHEEAAYRLQAMLGESSPLTEGLFFILLFILFLVVGYILVHVAFPVTKLPDLGILDYAMGFLLGAIVAVVFVAVVFNAIGFMVSVPWDNYTRWAGWHANFARSPLRPLARAVIQVYRWLFMLFMRPLPPVLTPQ